MTTKKWNVDHDWQEELVTALRRRGASPQQIGDVLADVDDRLGRSGGSARDELGDPKEYADRVTVSSSPAATRSSQRRAIALALLGLLGMFLALWGMTGVAKDAETVLAVPPIVPLVVGLLLAIGAALVDSLLGAKADVVHGREHAGGAKALLLNRLGPWIVVALTLVGMLLTWLKYR